MRYLTVTLNPAIDLVGLASQLVIGEVNKIQTQGSTPAGKGINVAQILKLFDCDVTATGFLGEENAQIFEHFLQQKGIPQTFIKVPGKTRTNIKITVQQETTDFNFSGFSVSEKAWQTLVTASQNWSKEYDFVIISGSLPQGITPNMFSDWCHSLTSQKLRWALDTSGEALQAGISAKPFLVKPNQEELRGLDVNGRKSTSLENDFLVAKELCHQGIQQVLLSCGAQGAYLIDASKEDILHARGFCNKVVSTVGAGDSLLATYLAQLGFSHSPIDGLKMATAVSSLIVEQATSLSWTPEALNMRLEEIICQKIKL